MRILFGSSPGTGHVQPMLPLALALQARGHEVLWATGPDGCEWVRGAGVAAAEVGLPTRARMVEYRRRWPESAALSGEESVAYMFPRLFGAVTAGASFMPLLALAREWRPHLVVSEAADFASPPVAAALGVPQVTHGFGLVVPPARVEAAGQFAAPLWEQVGLVPRPFGGLYDHLYIDIYPPSLQLDDLAHIGRIQRRRPESHTDSRGPLPSHVEEALRDPRPLVYLTFGTVFNANDAFDAAVETLAALPELVAVVTVGPDGDPTTFGDVPDHVAVARYVPQNRVFERAEAVASHAGSGTLLGALSAGIPQVCLPQAADQFRNAAACASSGAGVALVSGDVTPDRIRDALLAILHESRYRQAAVRLQDEIASMPSVEDVAAVVESLDATTGDASNETAG